MTLIELGPEEEQERPLRHLIADLDGTLIACGRYYSAACEDVVDMIKASCAPEIDRTLVRELIDFLDVWAIRINPRDGFRKERFPRSLAAAVMAAQGIVIDSIVIQNAVEAYDRGLEVFDLAKTPYELFDGALDVLRQYSDAGWRVWIFTKGDPDVQNPKIYKHGLEEVVDGWKVVPRKNREELLRFCGENGINRARAVYVGDSARDDMQWAKALGMRAVRVGTSAVDNWVHEQVEDPWSDTVIESVRDLPQVVPL